MPVTFNDLIEKYGSAPAIPDDDLYGYINRADVRKQLEEQMQVPDAVKTSKVGQEVRRRSMTDLFWLARYMLWETMPEGAGKPISENLIAKETHGELCDFFVKKDPTKSVAEQDLVHKERVLLYPRGGFKSTIDCCDVVQWILIFPDIRILFLTAADDLASGFVSETRGHFLIRPGTPSLMNIFFLEYCVSDRGQGNQYEFNCPLWSAKQINRKEPTLMASSIVSTLSGFHFEVIKADDMVSNKNSENEEQCERVIRNFGINRKMLRPFGYVDFIGTRYHEVDLYGKILDQNVGEIRREVRNPCLEIIDNESTGQRILIGRACVIKPEVAAQLEKDGKKVNPVNAGKDGVYLLLPTILTYQFLMQEYRKDEPSYEGQYNQNPRPASTTVFDRPLLVKNTVNFDEMPFRGPVSQTWDFAFSKKKGRDYSTASSVIWNDKGSFFVHDFVRGKFNPSELAKAVVDFAVKWRPFIIGIEDAAGSKLIEPTIRAEAEKTGDPYIIALCGRIDWFPPDTQKDAKKIRMAALHPWLIAGKMKFASYLPILETVYSEFEKCLFSHHHDDIPDVLSQQPRYAPRMQQLIDKQDIQTFSQLDAGWNMIFEENCDPWGRPGMGAPAPSLLDLFPPDDVKGEAPSGLDPILGAGLFG